MFPGVEDALHLDFETRSRINLRQTGPWVYGEDWSTKVYIACFARGADPVERWHPGDGLPDTIARAAADGVPWVAHNVGFERAMMHTQMIPKHGWPMVPIENWYCTASMAAAMSLPRDLERAAQLMGCKHQKDMKGHDIMKKLMKPAKTYKCLACQGTGFANGRINTNIPCGVCEGHGVILTWNEHPRDIELCTDYCADDVETERDLAHKVRPLPEDERRIWILDQKMNERGVRVDLGMVAKSQVIVKKATEELSAQTIMLTGGLLNTQVQKLRWWLAFEGLPVENLSKDNIKALLESTTLEAQVQQALELRQEAAKSSTAKLKAYNDRTCIDGRMRDNLMYHGAGTGRWSGRGAQLQNLPSRFLLNKDQVATALAMIEQGWSGEEMRPWLDTALEVVSACLRGMIVADEGNDLIACDYNAIEARGTAWLALCEGLLGVFERGEDPYLYMASKIYSYVDLSGINWSDKKQVDEAKNRWSRERQLGKIAVLGLGYQMGWEKFQASCAKERILIGDDEAKDTVFAYRDANYEIPELWDELDHCAFEAVVRPGVVFKAAGGRIRFLREGKWLFMGLPSQRLLSYAYPAVKKSDMPWIDENTGRKAQRWGVTYQGINSVTHRWGNQHAYGGKWTENAVQALCRDILALSMLRLEDAGYCQIVSVHDETVSEVPKGFGSVREVEEIMCEPVPWAAGLPMKAEGWRGVRYRK